jgi:DNA-binding NtrC family response regulator
LLRLFERQLAATQWTVMTAESGDQCSGIVQERVPDVVVLDYLLPDANGVDLACHIQSAHAEVAVIIATGAELSPEDQARCDMNGFPVLRKPFLAEELAQLIRASLSPASKPKQAAQAAGQAAARVGTRTEPRP